MTAAFARACRFACDNRRNRPRSSERRRRADGCRARRSFGRVSPSDRRGGRKEPWPLSGDFGGSASSAAPSGRGQSDRAYCCDPGRRRCCCALMASFNLVCGPSHADRRFAVRSADRPGRSWDLPGHRGGPPGLHRHALTADPPRGPAPVHENRRYCRSSICSRRFCLTNGREERGFRVQKGLA